MVLALKSRDSVSDTQEHNREEQSATFVISYSGAAMQGFNNVHKVGITLCWLVSEINWNTYSSLGMFMRVPAEYGGGLCQYDHVCDRKALKLTDSVAS